MRNLFEVIDEQEAESMIEQHDRYTFGRVTVQRIERRWWVYYGAKEAHVALDVRQTPTPFVFLADALDYALSDANLEAWEAAEARAMQSARSQ